MISSLRGLRDACRWRAAHFGVRQHLTGGRREIALTFDDGPGPFTPAILDVLAEAGVPATFFCVAPLAQARPDLIHRMTDEGHTVGSHGTRHCELRRMGGRRLAADLRHARTAIAAVAERPVEVYRPAHGYVDARITAATRCLRLTTWLWSVEPGDWRPEATTETIVAACDGASEGDVILLHDGMQEPLAPEALDRSSTVEALPQIIESARSRGLRFTTLAG